MKRIDKSTISVVIVLALTAVASFWGDGVCVEGSKQAVAWIAPLIGGLVSLGSSIAGAAMGNKASKQKASAYDQAWGEYEDWYEGQMNTSILDRADTLSMLKRYRDWQEENAKKYQTNAIKGGASEEAKIAYAQEANKGYADAISRIAAMGQQYKDRLSQNYATNRFNFQTKRADMATDGAQAVASGIANAGGVVGDLIGGIDWGG
ncbi:MAG: hypothetical protein IKA04_11105 [Alistipes sp.]|nr:hypothetical protein [Alistipes sp.]